MSAREFLHFLAVFSSVELGGITKYLMTGLAGNSKFCFPLGPVIKCLITTQPCTKPCHCKKVLEHCNKEMFESAFANLIVSSYLKKMMLMKHMSCS